MGKSKVHNYKALLEWTLLHMINSTNGPTKKVDVYDFFIEGGYTDYFTLNEAVNKLSEEGCIFSYFSNVNSSSYLVVTDKGKKTVSMLRSSVTPKEHYVEQKNTLNGRLERKLEEQMRLGSAKTEMDTSLMELRVSSDRAKKKLESIQARIEDLNDLIENSVDRIIGILNDRAIFKDEYAVKLKESERIEAEIEGRNNL